MKSIKTLLAVAVAAGAMVVAVDAQAQAKHGFSGARGHSGWQGGGHWHGGYWGPRVGLYFGAPLLFGAYAWGWPYYDSYYYGPRVIYRDVIREPEVIETVREGPAPQFSPVPESGAPSAPAQGPLYMNYCASAKAYFPKVSSCPEGWKFISPTQ